MLSIGAAPMRLVVAEGLTDAGDCNDGARVRDWNRILDWRKAFETAVRTRQLIFH